METEERKDEGDRSSTVALLVPTVVTVRTQQQRRNSSPTNLTNFKLSFLSCDGVMSESPW